MGIVGWTRLRDPWVTFPLALADRLLSLWLHQVVVEVVGRGSVERYGKGDFIVRRPSEPHENKAVIPYRVWWKLLREFSLP